MHYTTKPIDAVLRKLQHVETNCDGYMAACPCHDDRNQSLAVKAAADGTVLLYDHAGCTTPSILRAIGLSFSDLFPANKRRRKTKIGDVDLVSTYDYRDESQQLLSQKLRYEPKDFRWQRPTANGGWEWKRSERIVAYRLPELLANPSKPVIIVEGEKDADRLAENGFVATTSPDGASQDSKKPKWPNADEFNEPFRNRLVVIIPDNDDAGRAHALAAAKRLYGVARAIRIVDLPDLPPKGDVSDWFDAGHTADELVQLGRAATDFKPTAETAPSPAISGSLDDDDQRTDAANAIRLAAKYGDVIRWCDPWEKWLVWDGRRWAIDETRQTDTFAKEVSDDLWRLADSIDDKDIIGWVKKSNNRGGIEAMLALARSEPGIPISPCQLDQHPWLLNVENGTIDLRTGVLREHQRDDFLTKLVPVEFDPNAKCPTWMAFLKRILNADRMLGRYLWRLVGLSLTGSTREHILPFLWGAGSNGKSTFVGTILELLGSDYAMKAPPDLLMSKKNESHPTERADLFGKRFVACVETDGGRRMAESLVKEMTGGDRIRARRMQEDFWEFAPTHKVWLAANHKPIIHGTDHGIWRRVKLIPFTVKIPDADQDKELPEKLRAELPGILNWALAGCLDWQRNGLGEPGTVRDATADYREDMDVGGQFIAARCEVGSDFEVGASDLYRAYVSWCETEKTKPISQTAFGAYLSESGYEKKKTSRVVMRKGLKLRAV